MNELNIIVYFGESIAAGRALLNSSPQFTPELYQDKYFKSAFNAIQIHNPGTGNNEYLSYPAQNHTEDNAGGKLDFGFNLKLAGLLNGNDHAPACYAYKALGGSSLAPIADSGAVHSFDKATGTMYGALLTNITACHNQVVAAGFTPNYIGVVSILGLNDSSTLTASDDFETNMNNLISNLYTDSAEILAANPPFILTRPNILASGIGSIVPAYLTTVRNAIDTIAATNPNVTLVDFDNIPIISPTNLHHNWRGELESDSVADRIYAALFP